MLEVQRVMEVLDKQEVLVILQELQDKHHLLQAVDLLGIQVLDHPVVVEVQQGQAQVQVLQVVVNH